jgi:hypothetical protein
VLVVASVAAVLSRGEPALLDESTPDGVVQRYAAAVIDGDDVTAATYLTDGALEFCTEYQRQTDEELRVTLSSVDTFDHTADVEVTITTNYGVEPFGMSEYRENATFELLEIDGVWKVDTVPWQLTISCQGVNS